MIKQQRILIIGGTSSIAEHCAREWLSQNNTAEVILVGRSLDKLTRVSNDLIVRYPGAHIKIEETDFLSTVAIQACIDKVYESAPIDIALVAHGTLPDQEACENDLNLIKEAVEINALSPVLFAEAILVKMIQANVGHLAVIGSVAGDRGRKSNYIYGASKALIDTYLAGMQHRLAIIGSRVTATLIKPGPTATPMTANISGKGTLALPTHVAKDIVHGVEKGRRVIYAPSKWVVIMFIIRNLPFFLFKRMDI